MRKCVLFMSLLVPSFAIAQEAPAPAATPEATPAPAPAPEPKTPLVWTAKAAGMIAVVGGYNDNAVNTIDLPTQAAFPTDPERPQRTFGSTARGTRVGLQVNSIAGTPLFGDMKISGVVETDFFGGLPGQGLGDIAPIVRLRLAYAKADWGKLSFLMGQNWSVFAPRNPSSVARTFVPVGHLSGNLYTREPMLAVTGTVGPAALTVAATAPVDPTAQGGAIFSQANIPGPAENAAAPAGEARLAAAKKVMDGKLALEGGLSARMGTERLYGQPATGEEIHIGSMGQAVDAKIAWGSLVWVQGEAFQGENLDTYFGLDGTQLIDTNADPAITTAGFALDAESIPTSGGWVQAGVGYKGFELSFAYADQTLDEEKMEALNTIRQNQTWTAQLTWRPAPTFAVGLEYDYIETSRRAATPSGFDDAISRHFDIALALSF